MQYNRVKKGIFVDRPNRFIAHVKIEDKLWVCHVKNTGRCKELLQPGAVVYVSFSDNPARKTPCDLIAVQKGDRLVNIDSQAPNTVVGEYLRKLYPGAKVLPEQRVGESRIDFVVKFEQQTRYIEVKGVSLEVDNVAYFPDAPTMRGIKHVQELIECAKRGDQAQLIFVVQMQGVCQVQPNTATHPQFAKVLSQAKSAGVILTGLDCVVTPNTLIIGEEVPVIC